MLLSRYRVRVHFFVGKIRRGGFVFLTWKGDHTPRHVHVYRDGKLAPIAVSIFDRAALATALAGHDAVVNLATAIPPMNEFMSAKAWQANDRARRRSSTLRSWRESGACCRSRSA